MTTTTTTNTTTTTTTTITTTTTTTTIVEKAVASKRHNVAIHGGKKLGVIKSTATGIEVDIDGLGRGVGPVDTAGATDALQLPPWLRDQLPDADQMTQTDLIKLNELKRKDTSDSLDVFHTNPQSTYTVYMYMYHVDHLV